MTDNTLQKALPGSRWFSLPVIFAIVITNGLLLSSHEKVGGPRAPFPSMPNWPGNPMST